MPHAGEHVLGQPETRFGPLRTSVMSNSDYRNHPALARKLVAGWYRITRGGSHRIGANRVGGVTVTG